MKKFSGDRVFNPESYGVMRLVWWENGDCLVENHNGVADITAEAVTFFIKRRLMRIQGKNLSVCELDRGIIKIKGEISAIEYLT